MKYFLSAGIHQIDAVVIVAGRGPCLDIGDFKETFFMKWTVWTSTQ